MCTNQDKLLDCCSNIFMITIVVEVPNTRGSWCTKARVTCGSANIYSIQSVWFPRQMNEIGTYVMFQKTTLWTDHQSWKDCKFDCSPLNSFPRCATSYAGERGHCQLFPPPFWTIMNIKTRDTTNLIYPYFRTCLKSRLIVGLYSESKLQLPARMCILQVLRANLLKIGACSLANLQVLQMITAHHHGFPLSLLKIPLFARSTLHASSGKRFTK